MHLLFNNYSWILGAPYSASLFIDVTIKVTVGLIAHYEFVNKLVVFKAQFLKTVTINVRHLVLTREPIAFYMGKGVNYVKFLAKTA